MGEATSRFYLQFFFVFLHFYNHKTGDMNAIHTPRSQGVLRLNHLFFCFFTVGVYGSAAPKRDGTFSLQVCIPCRFPSLLCIRWIGVGISGLLGFVFDAFDTNEWAAGWLAYAGLREMDIKNVYMWWLNL
jgi:hypothetical protein